MSLNTYLESLPQYDELEESIARFLVLYPRVWDQDSYDWDDIT